MDYKVDDTHSVYVHTELGPELGVIVTLSEVPKGDVKTHIALEAINLSLVSRYKDSMPYVGDDKDAVRRELAVFSF
jgi:hypothetical protein